MKFRLFIVFSCFAITALAQRSDTIPFTLTEYNNILVDAVINGQDSVLLMFHSDANSVGLTSEATARLKKKAEAKTVLGKAWGGTGEASYVEGMSLKIGSYEWDSLTVWTNGRSGQTSDGKFGPNLFDGKYIEINFDHKSLIIHGGLPDIKVFKKYKMEMEEGSMFLSGSCYHNTYSFPNRFLLHSGYSGTILLDDSYASESKMNMLDITSESELRDSYGNVLKKKKSVLPRFRMEDYVFNEIPMGFFEGKIGNQKMSIIGGELIKRFNMVLDRKEGYIYLQPSQHFKEPIRDI